MVTRFVFSPSLARLSGEAFRLWFNAFGFCYEIDSHGRVPVASLRAVSVARRVKAAAAELCRAGLWLRERDEYVIADFATWSRPYDDAAKDPDLRPGRRYDVLARDGFACRYCGRKAPEVTLHVDHVVPRAKGGSDDPSNLVAACSACNQGKGVKSLEGAVS
jgi:hypothetical protein